MWLLIESFSLDRAVYFLPSREISLRSVSLLSPALLRPFFSLSRVPALRMHAGISTARVAQTAEISSRLLLRLQNRARIYESFPERRRAMAISDLRTIRIILFDSDDKGNIFYF